jgi:hypothetical protein
VTGLGGEVPIGADPHRHWNGQQWLVWNGYAWVPEQGGFPPGVPYGYGYGYGYPVAAPPGTSGLAIASLVLGIVWIYGIGSLLAVIFGHIARGQVRRGERSGGGMALAGLILGYVGLVGIVLLIVLVVTLSNNTCDPNAFSC